MDMMGNTSSQPAVPGGSQHLGSDQPTQHDAPEATSRSDQALVDSQLSHPEPMATPQRNLPEDKRKTGSRSSRKTKTYSKKNRKAAAAEPEPSLNGNSELEPELSHEIRKPALREPSIELGEFLPPSRPTRTDLPAVPESPAAHAGAQESEASIEASASTRKSKKRKRKQSTAEEKEARKSRRQRQKNAELGAEQDQNNVPDSQGNPGAEEYGADEEMVQEEQIEAEDGDNEEELLQAQLLREDGGEDEEQEDDEHAQPERIEEDQVNEEQVQEEVAEGALDDQLPTPPKSEQIAIQNQAGERQESSQSRVASWLDEHPEDPEEMVVPNGRARRATAEDDDEDHDDYDVPSDSGDDDEEETTRRSSARANGKRKRNASDRVSAGPSKKRARRSGLAANTDGDDDDESAKAPASSRQYHRADYPTSGPFTPAEIAVVESTLEDKRKEWDISQAEMNERIYNSSKCADIGLVLTEIGEHLRNRNRKAIQRFCRRHYNNYERGKWTNDQDDLLRDAYTENPNKWTYISRRVGRMPEDCRDRWRNHLVHGDARHTDVWTEPEEFSLVKAIKECLDAIKQKGGIEINHDNEDDYIAWQVVVQKMQGTRNRLQCSQKWKKIKARVDKEEKAQSAKELGQTHVFDDDSAKISTAKAAAKRRYKNMMPGDIYQILQEIQYGTMVGSFTSQDTFWAVVTRLHAQSPWNTQDRKFVYKELRKNGIVNEDNITANVDALVKWCEESFTPEVLAKRTTPATTGRGKKGTNVRKSSSRYISTARVVDDGEDGQAAGPAAAAAEAAEANGRHAEVAENNNNNNNNEQEEEEVRSAVSAAATPEDQDMDEIPGSEHTPIPPPTQVRYREPSPHVSESDYTAAPE